MKPLWRSYKTNEPNTTREGYDVEYTIIGTIGPISKTAKIRHLCEHDRNEGRMKLFYLFLIALCVNLISCRAMPTAFSTGTPAHNRAATPTNTPLPPTATLEPTYTPTPILTDTPTSPLCNSIRLFDLPSVSPSGKYSLEVTPSPYGANPTSPTKIIVRQTANPDRLSEIYPLDNRNVPPSFQVGFTANDNILASWGCGTVCSVGILYAPNGQMLQNNFGFFEISPSRNMAIDFPVPAGETPVSGDIRIIDLNTGQTLKTEHHSITDSPCCVTWGSLSVTLHYSCKNQTLEDLTIMLPNR